MPEWLYSLLVGIVIVGLVGWIWKAHAERDNERNSDIWDQIGRDSYSGMRRAVHNSANNVIKIMGRLDRHKERIEALERLFKEKFK